ncbi:MAG TPA: Smr/MutS family protein [Pyrinomonadaceae bacterium]|nr:Smr/MutS family protein [Pyrinomonadaceae bacterium]
MKLFQWLMKRSSADGPALAPRESADGGEAESDAIVDPYNPFPDPIEIPLSDILDLHTIPPRDVKCVVEAYLEEAHTAGFSVVRIIHGKGIGVQRDMVRSILARTSFVNDWGDAPPEAGGLGATVVRFRAN